MNVNVAEGLRSKWENFSDWSASKGMPWLKFVVPLLLVLVIGFGIYSLVAAPPLGSLTISVSDAKGNPIDGAKVMLMIGDKLVGTAFSVNGIAKFKDVPYGAKATAKVTAEGFAPKNIDFIVGESYKISLESSIVAKNVEKFYVQALDSYGMPIPNAEVTVRYGENVVTKRTDALGSAELEIEYTTQSLDVTVAHKNYEEVRQLHFLSQKSISVNLQSVQLSFAESTEKGSVSVRVTSEGQPVVANVNIYDSETNIILRNVRTGSDGVALIQNLGVGTKFYVGVNADGYLSYNGKLDTKTVSYDKINIDVKLIKATGNNSEEMKVFVYDETGAAYAGANVILYGMDGGKLETKRSNRDGMVSFVVSSSSGYYAAVVPKRGHLPQIIESINAGDEKTVNLEKAVEGNYGKINVHVTYRGTDMAGVVVSLFNENGLSYGVESTTKSNGVATFEQLPYEAVYVAATYQSKTAKSPKYNVAENLTIDLALGDPLVKMVIRTMDMESRKGVEATEINVFDQMGMGVATCTTDKTGACSFEVEEGKKIEFYASAADYVEYDSEIFEAKGGKTINAYLTPARIGRNLNITFRGFYRQGNGNPVTTVEPGMTYDAKFDIRFPSGVENSSALIRIGGEGTAAESNAVILKKGILTKGKLTYSSSYVRGETCESKDADELKWVEIKFPKGTAGSTSIVLPVRIRSTTYEGDSIEVAYRVYAETKAGGIYSVPDSDKYDCFAELETRNVEVGANQRECTGDACAAFYFVQGKRKGSQDFTVFLGQTFDGNFEIVYDGPTLQNVKFNLSMDSKFVNITKVTMTKNREQMAISRGLGIGAYIDVLRTGDVIVGNFTGNPTRTSQDITMTISLTSEKDETIISKDSNIIVSGTQKFGEIYVTPKTASANKANKIEVTVTDEFGNNVEGAYVEFYDDTVFLPECRLDLGGGLSQTSIALGGSGATFSAEYDPTTKKYIGNIMPVSIGKVGIRVSKESFVDYTACLINVTVDKMLVITPNVKNYTGNIVGEYNPNTQITYATKTDAIVVQNNISDPVSVSLAHRCPTGISAIYLNNFNLEGGKGELGGDMQRVEVTINASNNNPMDPNSIEKSVKGTCTLFATACMGTLCSEEQSSINVNLLVAHGCNDVDRAYTCVANNKPKWCGPSGKIISNCTVCGCPAGDECGSNGECAGLQSLFQNFTFPSNTLTLKASNFLPGDYYKFTAEVDWAKYPTGAGDLTCSLSGTISRFIECSATRETATSRFYNVEITTKLTEIQKYYEKGNISFGTGSNNKITGEIHFGFASAPGIKKTVNVELTPTNLANGYVVMPTNNTYKIINGSRVVKPIFIINNLPVTNSIRETNVATITNVAPKSAKVLFRNGTTESNGFIAFSQSKSDVTAYAAKDRIGMVKILSGPTFTSTETDVIELYSKDAIDGVRYSGTGATWTSCAEDYCTCEPLNAALTAFINKFKTNLDTILSRERGNHLGQAITTSEISQKILGTTNYSEVMVFKIANLNPSCAVLSVDTVLSPNSQTLTPSNLSGKILLFNLTADLTAPDKNLNINDIITLTYSNITGIEGQWLAVGNENENAIPADNTIYTFAQRYTPETTCFSGPVAYEIYTDIFGTSINLLPTTLQTGNALNVDSATGERINSCYGMSATYQILDDTGCTKPRRFDTSLMLFTLNYRAWEYSCHCHTRTCTYLVLYPRDAIRLTTSENEQTKTSCEIAMIVVVVILVIVFTIVTWGQGWWLLLPFLVAGFGAWGAISGGLSAWGDVFNPTSPTNAYIMGLENTTSGKYMLLVKPGHMLIESSEKYYETCTDIPNKLITKYAPIKWLYAQSKTYFTLANGDYGGNLKYGTIPYNTIQRVGILTNSTLALGYRLCTGDIDESACKTRLNKQYEYITIIKTSVTTTSNEIDATQINTTSSNCVNAWHTMNNTYPFVTGNCTREYQVTDCISTITGIRSSIGVIATTCLIGDKKTIIESAYNNMTRSIQDGESSCGLIMTEACYNIARQLDISAGSSTENSITVGPGQNDEIVAGSELPIGIWGQAEAND